MRKGKRSTSGSLTQYKITHIAVGDLSILREVCLRLTVTIAFHKIKYSTRYKTVSMTNEATQLLTFLGFCRWPQVLQQFTTIYRAHCRNLTVYLLYTSCLSVLRFYLSRPLKPRAHPNESSVKGFFALNKRLYKLTYTYLYSALLNFVVFSLTVFLSIISEAEQSVTTNMFLWPMYIVSIT